MDDGDFVGGQFHAGIDRRDRGIVPLRDLAEVDVGEDGAAETERLRHAGHVVNRNDAAEDCGEVEDGAGRSLQMRIGHRSVGGAEEHRLRGELLDPATGSDRLVVDADVRMRLLILVEPLRVDRIGEGGAGSVDGRRIGCLRFIRLTRGQDDGEKHCERLEFHAGRVRIAAEVRMQGM
jgi:hypothetical protein